MVFYTEDHDIESGTDIVYIESSFVRIKGETILILCMDRAGCLSYGISNLLLLVRLRSRGTF